MRNEDIFYSYLRDEAEQEEEFLRDEIREECMHIQSKVRDYEYFEEYVLVLD